MQSDKDRRSTTSALDQELGTDISIVTTFTNPGSPDTEWAAICEAENAIWYLEKLEPQIPHQTVYVVYEGSHSGRNGYSRGRFLSTFPSLEDASVYLRNQLIERESVQEDDDF